MGWVFGVCIWLFASVLGSGYIVACSRGGPRFVCGRRAPLQKSSDMTHFPVAQTPIPPITGPSPKD